jgi:MoaA/NifB/PqqE/SkfB family radical SAM enzyme
MEVKIPVLEKNCEKLDEIAESVTKSDVKKIYFVFSDNFPLYKAVPSILRALKVADRNGVSVNFNKHQRLLGIITNRLFVGPERVEINITNKCDMNCLFCWIHSPNLKEKLSEDWLSQNIDFNFLKKVVDESVKVGTERILFSGIGEPFLHPQIMDMIKYVKSKGVELEIVTNGASLTKSDINNLSEFGVDWLTVSISASRSESYAKLHPNQNEKTFDKIEKNLTYLKKLKKEKNTVKPHVKITNVINRKNYQEICSMIHFAGKIRADMIRFKPLVAPDKGIEYLLLTKEEIDEVTNNAEKTKLLLKKYKLKNDFKYFLKFLKAKDSKKGFYTVSLCKKIGCFVGWHFLNVRVNRDFTPCYQWIKVKSPDNLTFEQVWNSDIYRKFRNAGKNMISGKLAHNKCKMCVSENFAINTEIYEELKKNKLLQYLK